MKTFKSIVLRAVIISWLEPELKREVLFLTVNNTALYDNLCLYLYLCYHDLTTIGILYIDASLAAVSAILERSNPVCERPRASLLSVCNP